jgi:outer membrane protein assembly factor BamB
MRLSVIAVSVLIVASQALLADWPQMRGPTGQGHATTAKLPTLWTPRDGITWLTPIPGKGWSTPIVVNGHIYVTTAVPQGEGAKADQSLEIFKLKADTGAILASKQVILQVGEKAPAIHAKNSHASPTPIYEDGKLYVHFGHSGTACVNAETLESLWTNRDLAYKPVHGNGGSPLLYQDTLYISIDGIDRRSLVALDKKTGTLLWETKRSRPAKLPFSFGTPILVEIDKTPMVVTTSSDGLYGYDPKTGKELWFVEYSGYSVVPVPLFAHGMIYVCTGYNTPSILAVKIEKGAEKFTGKVAWRHRVDVPHNPSPVIVGDELYMVSDGGIATCLDAKTGKQHWRERIPGAYSASILHGAGHLYFLNEQGLCTVVKTGTTYSFVSSNGLDSRSLASIGVDGETLLIRTEKALHKVKGK